MTNQAAARMFGITDPEVTAAVHCYTKLLRASRAVQTRVEEGIAGACLTLTQLGVLEALLHKGAMSQRELGRIVLTSPGNMTDLLDKLCARGLVGRTRSGEDRRSMRVDLTDAGRRVIEELFPRHALDIAAAMAALAPDELDMLGNLLRKLGKAAAGTGTAAAGSGESLTEPPCDTMCSAERSTSNEQEIVA